MTAVHAADRPGGIAAAEAESERRHREDVAAAAALYPFDPALEAKAEAIVERFRGEPGLRSVWANQLAGVVSVGVDDLALFDALVEEFAEDPEVVIHIFEYTWFFPLLP